MEGFLLQEIQGLKLRALTLAHFRQVIRDIRDGMQPQNGMNTCDSASSC